MFGGFSCHQLLLTGEGWRPASTTCSSPFTAGSGLGMCKPALLILPCNDIRTMGQMVLVSVLVIVSCRLEHSQKMLMGSLSICHPVSVVL